MTMLSREALFQKIAENLHVLFDIPLERITLDAKLSEDLDIDSIDAVELIVKLQEITGRRIRPEIFRSVRTVGDVLTSVEELMAGEQAR